MNPTEIERLLQLQNSAYELLLWIDKRAYSEQSLLSDENQQKWRYAESCESWVRDIYGMIPQNLRPDDADIPAFARLFSAFFRTSFRVIENAPVTAYDYHGHESGFVAGANRKLMAGAPDGKKSSKAKAKIRESADDLRVIALEELALQNELFPSRESLQAVAERASLSEALTLWTYFHELERRADFASQGAAVRSLWQEIPKRERQNLTADKIIGAREVLVEALKNACEFTGRNV